MSNAVQFRYELPLRLGVGCTPGLVPDGATLDSIYEGLGALLKGNPPGGGDGGGDGAGVLSVRGSTKSGLGQQQLGRGTFDIQKVGSPHLAC